MTSPRALLPVCLFLLCVSVLCAQPVTFSDGTFNSGDWTNATKIQDGTPGQNATCDATQATGGGNPDPYRRVTQTYTAGPVTCAHLRAGALWDPRVRGLLTAIDYSYDLRDTAAFAVLVLQDGNYYQLRNQDNVSTQGSWKRFNRLGVVAGDFVRVAGAGPGKPDFGANAAPLQFGFASNNSPTGPFDTVFHSSSSGIDNWQITLYSNPGTITYADPTFLDSDWSAQGVPGLVSGGSTFSAGQVFDSGNPPPSRHVTHRFGPGAIYVAHLRSGAVYDPLIQPALVAIDFSYDLLLRNGTPDQPVSYSLLLYQGGSYYRAAGADSASSSSWQHVSRTRLRAADFFLIAGGGPSNPRFDPQAPPIQLGYLSFNDGAPGFSVRDSAIDNWSATFYAIPNLVLNPPVLSFTYQTGTTAPLSQNLRVLSSGFPIDFTIAQPSVSWLTLSSLGGTTPATIGVGINPGNLPPGNYLTTITASGTAAGVPANNGAQTVSVNLLVTSATGFVQSVSPDNVPAGSPGASITVTGSGFGAGSMVQVNGTPIPTTVLNSTSLAAVIPASFLTASGVLQITVAGANGAVLFRVNQSGPVIGGVSNSASADASLFAPGEMVSIYGSRLGPEIPGFAVQDPPGRLSNNIGGVRVLFDGLPAPLLYVQAGQVNAIVPYAVAGRAAVNVQIEYLGVRSNPFPLPVGPAAPGLFTYAGGIGQGAILNQDNSYNSAANPADRNSVIQIFATGEGSTNPPGQDGLFARDIYPKPLLPVQVFIGGLLAETTYAGAAPNFAAGFLQVNARIPSSVTPGPNVSIAIFVGTFRSQANVTVAVK